MFLYVFPALSLASTLTTGGLSISLSGLPSGASATVTITPPGGSPAEFTSSGDNLSGSPFNGIATGSYTVSANTVSAGRGTPYTPSPATQAVTVVGGQTAGVASASGSTAHYRRIEHWPRPSYPAVLAPRFQSSNPVGRLLNYQFW